MDMLNDVLGAIGFIAILFMLDHVVTGQLLTGKFIVKIEGMLNKVRGRYLYSTRGWVERIRSCEDWIVHAFRDNLDDMAIEKWRMENDCWREYRQDK